MQILESTAEEIAEDVGEEKIDLENPETNIKLGTKYFSDLLKYFEGNYELAIAAYNAGIGTVTKWIKEGVIRKDGQDIENIPYKETNNYVRRVFSNYRIYEKLY